MGHCRTKWNSSSICWVVQDSHNLSCLFLFWYLPISTFKQCEESLIRDICFLILFCFVFLKYGCIIPRSWFTKCLNKKHLLEFSKSKIFPNPVKIILVLRRVPSSCKRILYFLHPIVGIHKKILKYSFHLLVVYTNISIILSFRCMIRGHRPNSLYII